MITEKLEEKYRILKEGGNLLVRIVGRKYMEELWGYRKKVYSVIFVFPENKIEKIKTIGEGK